ncbi:hypothetical protein [Thiolinea disciformis]|uniref:hypothetical protein n=1 Tax=Thiolinea disciformis TaxID=125614 RepID=UPI000376E924|nr:hypothetical protein [Thiolinea disciformis]
MLKKLKIAASVFCLAALLTACQKDKEEVKTATAQATSQTTDPATPAEPSKPVETFVPSSKTTDTTTPATVAQQPHETTVSKDSTDPFAYCQTAGTIDKPTSGALPEKLIQAMVKANMISADLPQLKEPGFVQWRCMDSQVYACVVGANIPCEAKADISKEPNDGMIEFCKTDANAENIPAAATGRTTVYTWSCKDGKPVIGAQVTQVDSQGYPADFWTVLAP